ncbi:MAG TPA: hypothetical protein VF234_07020 [Limnochordia bacterium]
MSVLVVLGFLLISLLDLPLLWKMRRPRIVLIYGLLWCAGLSAALLYVHNVPLDAPVRLLHVLFEPLSRAVMRGATE